MGIRICLIVLAGLGIAQLGLPFLQEQLPDNHNNGVYVFWLFNLRCFAIPIVFFLLTFTQSHFVRFAQIGWALWVSALSITLLFQSDRITPYVTTYGFVYIGGVGVLGLALMLFTVMKYTKA